MANQKDSALTRWSRLKRETETERAQAASQSKPQGLAPVVEADAAASDPAARDAEFRLEDLPDVETLTYQSDFTAFMRQGVPAALQQAALSKLWRSDPVFACQDGLTDIGIDFRTAADIDPEAHVLKLLEPQSPEELALSRDERLPRREPALAGGGSAPAQSGPDACVDEPVQRDEGPTPTSADRAVPGKV